jgi:phosphoribosyl 1,2-cyclic phosphodiesterase
VATERTRVLVDCGLSVRETARRMALVGDSIENLNAVIVTHEHSDHIAGLARMVRRHKVPVYATPITSRAIDWEETSPIVEHFQAGSRFSIGDLEIDSFTIPHDAIDPVGFCVRSQGVKFAIATDLGYVTESIRYHLRGAAVLLLESNHDLDMLKVGPYPWSVKQRVMSRVGHLSNLGACDFIHQDFDGSAASLILGHLSEQNNHPEIVRLMADQALAYRGFRTRLVVAEQKTPTEAFVF